MKTYSVVCVISVLVASSSNGWAGDSFDDSIRPLLRDYCVTCHSTEKQEGELDLERFHLLEKVKQHADVWERVQGKPCVRPAQCHLSAVCQRPDCAKRLQMPDR